ncbi:hypothetical protein DFA_07081 [Cavenderia fasciculata]|uniref:WD40 repeat-containing protein n=1 Tax=Cavenderia fasciculata TaxID=261658 RepID=F4PVF6_CACFS|nr:uncharacterized protein DFA_07081 [Cavenderia fasciculata]EGG19970.1 hypothetical protein DFA_07081 [Cavenderia fasciculata]|eukprot:XP_004366953.1 hypothetical protein DFA_07081 [Cavenderia fasciculata]
MNRRSNSFDTPPIPRRAGGSNNSNNNSNNSNSTTNHNNSNNNNHSKINEKKRKVSSIQSDSSTTTTITTSNGKMIEEIPGYYYDQEKDRHFKITRENRKQAEAAMKQLKISTGQLEEKKEYKNDKERLNGCVAFNSLLLKRELFGTKKCLSCKLKELYIMDNDDEKDKDKEEEEEDGQQQQQQQQQPLQFKFLNTSEFSMIEPLMQTISINNNNNNGQQPSDKISVASGLICTNHRTGSLGTFWIGVENQKQQQQQQISSDDDDQQSTTSSISSSSSSSHNLNSSNYNIVNSSSFTFSLLDQTKPIPSSRNKLSLFLNYTTEKSSNSLISSIRSFQGQGVAISYLGGEGCNGSIKVLSPFDHDQIFSFELEHRQSAWTVEWHPSGQVLAVGGSGTIYLVDALRGGGGQPLKSLFVSKSDIFSLDFNSSGQLLASGSRDGKLRLFDIRLPEAISTTTTTTTTPTTTTTLQFNQKKNPKEKDIKSIVNSPICSLKFLPQDDNYLIVSTMNGKMVKWDRRVGKQVIEYQHHVNSHSLLRVSVSSDNQFMASGGEDKCIRLWDLNNGHLLRTLGPFNSIVQSTVIVNNWFDEYSNMCVLGNTNDISYPSTINQNSLLNPFDQISSLDQSGQRQRQEENNSIDNNNNNNNRGYYYEPVLCFNPAGSIKSNQGAHFDQSVLIQLQLQQQQLHLKV